MKFSYQKFIALILGLCFFLFADAQTSSTLSQLKIDYLSTPLGIDVTHPRFSWQMDADPSFHGFRQMVKLKKAKGLKKISETDTHWILELQSGSYQFIVQ